MPAMYLPHGGTGVFIRGHSTDCRLRTRGV